MDLSLKERLARLGPIRDIDRVPSGSPAVFVLRLYPDQADVKTIDAAMSLARRGISMLRAKRAVEELLTTLRLFIELPKVENVRVLAAELNSAGIAAAPVYPAKNVDVRALRERLNLTREQFALRYGLELETLRNWEMGRREPDTAAKSYLRAIGNAPEHVEEAYAPTPRMG